MNLAITPAQRMEGLILPGDWQVISRLEGEPDRTGSAFSVGYLVSHPSGQMGYLKALDFATALNAEDPPKAIAELSAAYIAERDLLELCGHKNLKRVVRALSAGTIQVEGSQVGAVSYLIFELANDDVRGLLKWNDPSEQLVAIKLTHHAAVGLSQLHKIKVAHQDIKPSNLLVWQFTNGPDGKLGDLGCAHMSGRPAPHDEQIIAGDCSYASPEQLYRGQECMPSNVRRVAADIYMLGNLLCFCLTSLSYNCLASMYLDDSQHWTKWGGSFEAVLPGLIDAHGLALERIREVIHRTIADEATKLIDELCYPDPRLRGDRRGGYQSPFDLHRYVARLNLLHHRALMARV